MSIRTPSVLVAYDGSTDAELALTFGIETAELTGVPLKVVVVNDAAEPLGSSVNTQAERWAETITARARVGTAEVDLPVDIVLEHGGALPVLLDLATAATVLVVGSRGHNLWDTLWLGSTSQHLAGHADCTVAVVRRRHNPRAKRILVGIDGSVASRRALEFAVERAAGTGEEVVAVHAFQDSSFAAGGRIGALAVDIETDAIEAAECRAAELVAGIGLSAPDVVVRSSAVVGRAGRVLCRLADDASLVVVGSRGRTPVAELVLGSVSQEVLHKAECPVAVVR